MLYLNDASINVTRFPDNTSQVWNINIETPAKITWEYTHEAEFLELAQLKMLLEKENVKDISLNITYLPYARQDKAVSNTTTFALNTFAQLLNSLNFKEIVIMDPHSTVALDLIKNSHAEYPKKQLAKVMELTQSDYVCYPDKGALNKYTNIYPYVYSYGEKIRDQLTGNITSYKLVDEPYGKKILIVDDICDGGMTFKLLTKELLDAGAKEVNLFVTHGIFSKGLKTLKESGIKRVFTKEGEIGEHQQQLTYRRL